MEKINEIIHNIEVFFAPGRKSVLDFISLITGFDTTFSAKFILYTLGLLIFLFVIRQISKLIKRKLNKTKANLIEVYDKILYFIVRKEYATQIQKKISSIRELPSLQFIDTLTEKREKPDYFNSKQDIKNGIQELESKLQVKIVSEENRNTIKDRHNKINIIRIIRLLTLGIQFIAFGGYLYVLFK